MTSRHMGQRVQASRASAGARAACSLCGCRWVHTARTSTRAHAGTMAHALHHAQLLVACAAACGAAASAAAGGGGATPRVSSRAHASSARCVWYATSASSRRRSATAATAAASNACCSARSCSTTVLLPSAPALQPPPPPRAHPWLGAPGPRHAVAVHRLAHCRAARAGDIACSTHYRQLWRLPWCSPRAGTACHPQEPGSIACRLERTWVQPSSWHRLPPPCALQRCVPPSAVDLVQPSCWHRLPPSMRLAVRRATITSPLGAAL
jgi:hypothetical protein